MVVIPCTAISAPPSVQHLSSAQPTICQPGATLLTSDAHVDQMPPPAELNLDAPHQLFAEGKGLFICLSQAAPASGWHKAKRCGGCRFAASARHLLHKQCISVNTA